MAMTEARAAPSMLSLIARAVMVFIGLLPWAVPFGRLAIPDFGRALDWGFAWVCHRSLSRTLYLAGAPMPVCSRCAGIFAGLALGALLARPRLSVKTWRWLALAATVLMVADVAA